MLHDGTEVEFSAMTTLPLTLDITDVVLITNLTENVDAHCHHRTASINPWMPVGNMNDYDNIVKKYPHLDFEWGVRYNSYSITPVEVTNWNRGIRIIVRNLYTHGDDASSFHRGTAMWTRGTDDAESKNGWFHHRYVGADMKPCCGSNGNTNVQIFARRF